VHSEKFLLSFFNDYSVSELNEWLQVMIFVSIPAIYSYVTCDVDRNENLRKASAFLITAISGLIMGPMLFTFLQDY